MNKEYTLFPEEEMAGTKRKEENKAEEVLVLEYVSPEIIGEYCEVMNRSYCKEELASMAKPVYAWTAGKKLEMKDKNGKVGDCIYAGSLQKKSFRKKDMATSIAIAFSNMKNMAALVATLPEELVEIIKWLLQDVYVDIKRIYGTNAGKGQLEKVQTWFGKCYYISRSPWMEVGSYLTSKGEIAEYAYMKPFFTVYFYRLFSAELFAQEPPVEESSLAVVQTESDMVKVYPELVRLQNLGKLKFGKNGKIHAKTLEKFASATQLQDFFPDSSRDHFRYRRILYLVAVLLEKRKQEEVVVPLEFLLKEELFAEAINDFRIVRLLLPQYEETCRNLQFGDNVRGLQKAVRQAFCALPEGWVSTERVLQELLKQNGSISLLKVYDEEDYKCNFRQGLVVDMENYRDGVLKKTLCYELFLLAAVGLLDVAFCKKRGSNRAVEQLDYVRLTALGKYVFGIAEDYRIGESVVSGYRIDPDRLMVCQCGEGSLMHDSFLREIGTDIGNNRFVFSRESFLKKCVTAIDIRSRVRFFNSYIGSTAGMPVWQQFFAELEQQEQLEPVVLKDYCMYRVSPSAAELIRALNTDPELKEMVVRAEDYLILVRLTRLSDFKRRLRHYGILMD